MTTYDDRNQPRFIGKNAKENLLAYMADDARFRIWQAEQEGAALRGEFGPRRQLRAMSEQYKALKAAGRLDEAAAVKARGIEILNSQHATEE